MNVIVLVKLSITELTDTEPTASETFYKMEDPPPPPPALMMLLQNIMDTTSTVREQTKLPL